MYKISLQCLILLQKLIDIFNRMSLKLKYFFLIVYNLNQGESDYHRKNSMMKYVNKS
jgi:hypothetical protein